MSEINYQDWFEEIKEHIIRDTEKRVIAEVIETLNSGYVDADGEAWRDIFIEALRKRYGVNDD